MIGIANAFVGDRGSVALDHDRAFASCGANKRLAVGQPNFGDIHQRQRFRRFLAQRFDAFLHRGDFVGMRGGDVVLLVGVFSEVVEVNARRNQRTPDEFPIALAHGAAERLDIIDDFRARRRLVFADGAPDIQAVERLAFGGGRAGEIGKGRINVHDVNDAVHRLRA